MAETLTAPSPSPSGGRTARPRRYLMCAPTHFTVSYSINPWMSLDEPVDPDRAQQQWAQLRQTLVDIGADVELIEPAPGLPDMVFAANGGIAIGDRAMAPRFRNVERQEESEPYAVGLERAGYPNVVRPSRVNEGQGDFLMTGVGGGLLLGGTGFRSDPLAGAEVQAVFGVPVVSLVLVDPRFYHLDTALTVLDGATIAYWPGAFSPSSRDVLQRLFPDAIEVAERDAAVLGLNAVSDGKHVVLPAEASGYVQQLAERGFEPVPVDLREFRKAGGGPKCCVLERL